MLICSKLLERSQTYSLFAIFRHRKRCRDYILQFCSVYGSTNCIRIINTTIDWILRLVCTCRSTDDTQQVTSLRDVSCRPITCDLNNADVTLTCCRHDDEVYVPFDAVERYFEVCLVFYLKCLCDQTRVVGVFCTWLVCDSCKSPCLVILILLIIIMCWYRQFIIPLIRCEILLCI